MTLCNAQGQWEKYLTMEPSSTSNPVEDMCATVSKFQSARIGDGRKSRKTNVDKHGMFTEISRIEGDNRTSDSFLKMDIRAVHEWSRLKAACL